MGKENKVVRIKIIKLVIKALGYELGKQFPNSPVWMLKEKKKAK
jgi:hypothetical protein